MKLVSFTASGRSSYGVVAGDVISTGTPEGVGFARKPPRLPLAEAARKPAGYRQAAVETVKFRRAIMPSE